MEHEIIDITTLLREKAIADQTYSELLSQEFKNLLLEERSKNNAKSKNTE